MKKKVHSRRKINRARQTDDETVIIYCKPREEWSCNQANYYECPARPRPNCRVAAGPRHTRTMCPQSKHLKHRT